MPTNDLPSVQSVERKVSGAEGLPVKKVAKVGREVSGAGDVTATKTPKVVASEPREHQTKRLPVSTPFKGRVRVGLTKKFKGKLHDVMIVKRPSSSSPALLSMRRTTPLKTDNCSD